MSPMSLDELSREELFSYVKELEEKLKRKTKYGLVWEDKTEDVVLECENKYPILKNIKERSIRNDKNGPVNVLIEGDNYHALQILNYTHKGKVDVIYIDPPYNTGNKDFIYNDSFVDSEDGYKHSKWLSFMEMRLKLAKELLKDTGVIFISIDDNEQAQLKLLCDGVFGINNFIGNIVWKKSAPRNDIKSRLSSTHEYVLTYFVNRENSLKGIIEDIDKYMNPDNDKNGSWKEVPMTCNKNYKERPNLYYPVINDIKEEIWPSKNRVWSVSKEKLAIYKKEGRLYFKNGKPKMKKYLKDSLLAGLRFNPISSLQLDFSNKQGSDTLTEIFPEKETKMFDYPKPVNLIKFLINQSQVDNPIILDFFAGSGTTGHAVLELNKEDGGNRQFILVTNNGDEKSEHKIAEKITYERLKRVMGGYKNKKGEKVEGLGGNLEYLKCDFIKRSKHTDNLKFNIVNHVTDVIALRENTFESDLIKTEDGEVVYKIMSGVVDNLNHSTAIYYDLDDGYLEFMKKDLDKKIGTKSAYIFSLSNPVDMIDDLEKWNKVRIEEMPNNI
jgi:adenine-specific DNA-methyltransferase